MNDEEIQAELIRIESSIDYNYKKLQEIKRLLDGKEKGQDTQVQRGQVQD
jgi:hypothetical protein